MLIQLCWSQHSASNYNLQSLLDCHTGFPPGTFNHNASNWRYWVPISSSASFHEGLNDWNDLLLSIHIQCYLVCAIYTFHCKLDYLGLRSYQLWILVFADNSNDSNLYLPHTDNSHKVVQKEKMTRCATKCTHLCWKILLIRELDVNTSIVYASILVVILTGHGDSPTQRERLCIDETCTMRLYGMALFGHTTFSVYISNHTTLTTWHQHAAQLWVCSHALLYAPLLDNEHFCSTTKGLIYRPLVQLHNTAFTRLSPSSGRKVSMASEIHQ